MTTALDQLVAQREALVARCAEQRGRLTEALSDVQRGLSPHQLALDGWRAVKSHPLAFGLIAALAALAGPRRLFFVLSRGVTAYSLVRRVWSLARRR